MSVTRGTEESTYTLPNDAPEANRLDMQHELFRLTFKGKLIFAPIGPQPAAILDIGCGTSTWAIEVANLYPDSKVYGIDLGQPQTLPVPDNYDYMVGNFEKPWPFEDAQFDYIHGRFINVAMSEHKFVIAEAFRCLRPGGWFEMQEFSLPGITTVKKIASYWDLFVQAAAKLGRNFRAPISWTSWLTEAGFENVQRDNYEWPIGPRNGEADERMVKIGEMAMTNYIGGLRGFTLGFMTRGAGWTEEQAEEYVPEIRRALEENPGENVIPIHVICGQKPGPVSG